MENEQGKDCVICNQSIDAEGRCGCKENQHRSDAKTEQQFQDMLEGWSKPTTLQELFTDERRWTKYTLGRNAAGAPLGVRALNKATCFCLSGGFCFVYGFGKAAPEWARLKAAILRHGPASYGDDVVQFNDHHKTTIEDIRAIVKEADI